MKKEGGYGEKRQEDEIMIRYLTDIKENESFDLPVVKTIAKRFLEKMMERRDITGKIYVQF